VIFILATLAAWRKEDGAMIGFERLRKKEERELGGAQ
jgi:hypothetical protein